MARCDAWYAVTAHAGGSDLVQCVKPAGHEKPVEGKYYSGMALKKKTTHTWTSKDGTDRESWPESKTYSRFEPKPRRHR
jgi:hypothetical protein